MLWMSKIKMGQYYTIVNIDKKEFIIPEDYKNTYKLMDHSYIGNELVGAVLNILNNEWKGDRVIWAGDYADEEGELFGFKYKLYDVKENNFRKTKPTSININEQRKYFLVNELKKEFVDISKCEENGLGLIVSPTILFALGNGRGGGDYREDNELLVGSWAGEPIATTKDYDKLIEEGYTELTSKFN